MATTLELNQRIVYAGLVRMSDDRNLIKSAFTHWHDNHSSAALDIFEVVTELVDYLGLGVNEKKGLMIGLHNASAQLYEDLKPVPPYILAQGSGEQSAAPTQDSQDLEPQTKLAAHIEVTANYLQNLSSQIKRKDPSTHAELVKAVADEGLEVMSSVVSDWARAGLISIQIAPTASVSECQDLAHHMYVMVCDFLGPVESDIIVNRVISDLAALEASREFNPSKLL